MLESEHLTLSGQTLPVAQSVPPRASAVVLQAHDGIKLAAGEAIPARGNRQRRQGVLYAIRVCVPKDVVL
ncbi:MAG: hypothetical protein KatS3mg105_3786 [Gemmatales bacterium]|nr:MAG: hypothetical protein KatS3mg105_3786 [Gemmatales bacterium]